MSPLFRDRAILERQTVPGQLTDSALQSISTRGASQLLTFPTDPYQKFPFSTGMGQSLAVNPRAKFIL